MRSDIDVRSERSLRVSLVWTGFATAVFASPVFFASDVLLALRIVASMVGVAYLFAFAGPGLLGWPLYCAEHARLLFDYVRLLPWLFAPWLIAPSLMLVSMAARPAHHGQTPDPVAARVLAETYEEAFIAIYVVLASASYGIWIVRWVQRGGIGPRGQVVVWPSSFLAWCITTATAYPWLMGC